MPKLRKVRSRQIKQDKLGAGDQRAPQNPSPGYPPEKRAAVNGPYNCKYDLTTHGDIWMVPFSRSFRNVFSALSTPMLRLEHHVRAFFSSNDYLLLFVQILLQKQFSRMEVQFAEWFDGFWMAILPYSHKLWLFFRLLVEPYSIADMNIFFEIVPVGGWRHVRTGPNCLFTNDLKAQHMCTNGPTSENMFPCQNQYFPCHFMPTFSMPLTLRVVPCENPLCRRVLAMPQPPW